MKKQTDKYTHTHTTKAHFVQMRGRSRQTSTHTHHKAHFVQMRGRRRQTSTHTHHKGSLCADERKKRTDKYTHTTKAHFAQTGQVGWVCSISMALHNAASSCSRLTLQISCSAINLASVSTTRKNYYQTVLLLTLLVLLTAALGGYFFQCKVLMEANTRLYFADDQFPKFGIKTFLSSSARQQIQPRKDSDQVPVKIQDILIQKGLLANL